MLAALKWLDQALAFVLGQDLADCLVSMDVESLGPLVAKDLACFPEETHDLQVVDLVA